MKRILTCIALTATLTIGTGMTTANATTGEPVMAYMHSAETLMHKSGITERWTSGPCRGWLFERIFPRLGTVKVDHRSRAAIRCAVERYRPPGGLSMALCIAYRESGGTGFLWPWALNPSGSAGLYQFISSTWESARDTFRWLASKTSESRFNARSAALFYARYARQWGLGAWGGACSA